MGRTANRSLVYSPCRTLRGILRSPQGSHCTSRRGHKPGLHKRLRLRSPRNRNCRFPRGRIVHFTDVTDAAILWAKRTVLIQVTGAIPAWTFSAIRRTGIAVFPIFANAVSASGNTRPPNRAEGLLLRGRRWRGCTQTHRVYTTARTSPIHTSPRCRGYPDNFLLRGWQQGRCCTRPQCRRLGQRSRCIADLQCIPIA